MSLEDTGGNKVDLEGFTEDAFVAAASLADLALSGVGKEEAQELNLELSNEHDKNTQKRNGFELVSSLCVNETPGTSFPLTTSEVGGREPDKEEESLINKYDDFGKGEKHHLVVSEELEATENVAREDCEAYGSFRIAPLVDTRLNSSCLTFEHSESGSEDSFRREVGLKEKTAGIEEANSTPVPEGEEEECDVDDSEERTRCPCGKLENFGTMIQCDECKVWQHAKCVGFRKLSEIPEHYFCEECRPDQVRENSVIYKRRYVELKRSRKMNRNRAELERLERIIESSEAVKSSELKISFCEDLKKKFETSPKIWDNSVLFKKYSKYLKENEGVERESVIAGLEIISGLSGSDVEERLLCYEKQPSDSVDVKAENEESGLVEPNESAISTQEKVKKRKRTNILNESSDIGDKVASSREERKMQQILLQFKRLEEREEKRKHKSSGSSLSCANSDDNLSARFRKSSHRTTSVDSDEKCSSLVEADEYESDRHRTTSIRDCVSSSSRELDDLKLEERIWEEENPITPFHNLPGPSVVGSTLFTLETLQCSPSNSFAGNSFDSLSRFQGYWKKEKLLKLFRESLSIEQQDGLHSLMSSNPREKVLPPVKKKLLMDAGSFLLSPASSSGVKTGVSTSAECGDALSSTLMNITFAEDTNSYLHSLHATSLSRTSDSLQKDIHVDSWEKGPTGNVKDKVEGAVLKGGESSVNINFEGLDSSSWHFRREVYNTSLKTAESCKEVEVDSTFSSNIRQNFNREFSTLNENLSSHRNSSHDELVGNNTTFSIARNIKGRSLVGAYGENSRLYETDRNRKARFHNPTRQWSPNKKPRRNFDAWRDFRKQNGWH